MFMKMFILFMFYFMVYNMNISNMFYVNNLFINDNFMVIMIFLTFFISYLIVSSFEEDEFFLFFIMFFCMLFFLSFSILMIYMTYEMVMLPMVALIMMKGWYSERLYASMVMLSYTLLFSLPSLLVILMMKNSFMTVTWNMELNNFANFWIMLMFLVKLPIWGLHYWLPLAHVEAPTSGSMILAGILLKLGGYGLIRFNIFVENYLLTFFIYGLIMSTFACCFQLDVKRIVAYSSVSHMMIIPFLIMSNNVMSYKVINMIMFSHGFSSMMLFYWVGLMYKCLNTRNLIFMKGLFYNYPTMVFLFIILNLMNINMPPFMGYFAEVFSFANMLNLTSIMMIILIIYFMLSMVYMINMLTMMFLYNKNSFSLYTLELKEIMMFFYMLLISMLFLFKMETF